MSKGTQIKATHKAVKEYYAALQRYAGQKVAHEGAVRSAFQNLLAETGRKFGWTLIPELTIDANGQTIRPDGTSVTRTFPRSMIWNHACLTDWVVERR